MSLNDNVTLMRITEEVKSTNDNFIPANTTYNINAEGTGDFATLEDFVDFINGKYCNGEVIVQLAEGTYNLSKMLSFIGHKFNISRIRINGAGIDKTILKSNQTVFNVSSNACLFISNLTMDGNNKSAGSGVTCHEYGVCILDNIKVTNCQWGIFYGWNSRGSVKDTFTVENCNIGVECQNHGFLTFEICTINMKNVTTGFTWLRISTISIIASTYTFTNVTTRADSSINSWSSKGICQADNAF